MATTAPPQSESVPAPFAASWEGLRVSADFLAALRQSIEREFPQAADRILSEIGRRWGAADMQEFLPRAPQLLGGAPEAVHIGVLLQTWWGPRTAGGWGAASFDFGRAAQRVIVVELRNS